jgi:predicted RNA-binding protein associated with RNAse of E/G family
VDSQTGATITERKTRLDGTVAEFACTRLLLEPGRRAVLRYVIDREAAIGDTGIVVRPGMVTVAHYWTDRPFNVYHWLDRSATLAYYCNVAETTAITDRVVAYTDLAVDVLLRPSGAIDVLDEDEIPPDLEPRHRLVIAKALEILVTDARRLAAEVERETRALL